LREDLGAVTADVENPMIVFVLRHADRMPEPNDALKSPEGFERAELLARMLKESGIRAAYRSDTIRTRDTLQPLKQALGAKLVVEVVPLGGADGVHEQHIIAAVKALPADATAVVIGHSDTVVTIIKGLTGQTVGKIEGFDKLFVLSIPAAGAASVTLLRYGAAA
jgi:phosphohistidine phosphatase SixA